MITVRPSAERGHADHGWLLARHSFSFAGYHDPRFMNFGPLRVLNQDIIRGGGGFGTHPHDNMEIITWVLRGALEHKDNLGNGSVIRPGDVQFMSAGTGITHSEFNASQNEDCEVMQMWILPAHRGNEPRYGQRSFADEQLQGRLQLIASGGASGDTAGDALGDSPGDAADEAIAVDQDIRLHAGRFDGQQSATLALKAGRMTWVHVPCGSLKLNGLELASGDGAAVRDTTEMEITAAPEAEIIIFDLPIDI